MKWTKSAEEGKARPEAQQFSVSFNLTVYPGQDDMFTADDLVNQLTSVIRDRINETFEGSEGRLLAESVEVIPNN